MHSRPQRPGGLLAIGGWLTLLGAACSFPSVMVEEESVAEPPCRDATDCGTPASLCERATCDPVTGCGTEDIAEGEDCRDGGGICGEDGSCVDCIRNDDCSSMTCSGGACVPATCTNGMLDGDESAEDCGGMCAPCDDGKACESDSDCVSGACNTEVMPAVCAPCGGSNPCPGAQFCDSLGVCQPELSNGAICESDAQCTSEHCVEEETIRVCCDAPCDGLCESCLKAKHQLDGQNGSCHPTADGFETGDECRDGFIGQLLRRKVCDGNGQCRNDF